MLPKLPLLVPSVTTTYFFIINCDFELNSKIFVIVVTHDNKVVCNKN
jgi:hypothetical protein